ncbi:hypothetical protein ANOM_006408 [Aspergillus nomiae NRRL 13137]|uniref:Nephrocystin 3-like N-terminal domain-containing protein n=1 Tax=Aspergillus nomiae NRRL (strain ATCC 15546 / NRRL 13137 / CBS 260.88 / M93) TaxID=1509407 RepID=A0A0L1J0M2_ASPN3|nr:uncharacterized protein ANOM_006408 [Aspergillus nomiae NRRL 13137]KNG84928.1 hypothetical protein ANOM_006408 [Aspergillus nomiae NRRL 13137]
MYGLHITNRPASSSNYLVIAIHGIGGEGNDTWDTLPGGASGYVRWFEHQNAQVAMYSYPVKDGKRNIFTREGLRSEAVRLLQAISDLNRGRDLRLLFVGHDVGGTLIKEALTEAAFGDPKFRSIFSSTFALVNQDFTEANSQQYIFIWNVSSMSKNDEERVFDSPETQMSFYSAWEGYQENRQNSHRDMSHEISRKAQNKIRELTLDRCEKLIQSQKFQDWDSSPGRPFLVVQNAPAAVAASMLWKNCLSNACSSDNPQRCLIQYFEFNEHDCRYNSVDCMLSTLLTEICCKYVKAFDALNQLSPSDGKSPRLNMEDQFSLLLEVLSMPTCPEIVWILVNLNENILQEHWLLDKFAVLTRGTEIKFKALLVNCKYFTDTSSVFQVLDYPATTYDHIDGVSGSGEQRGLDTPATEIIISNPALQIVGSKLNALLRSSSADPDLHRMLMEWLPFVNQNIVIALLDQTAAGDTIPKALVFQYILKSATEFLKATNKIQILQLIVLAFRPLTIQELLDLAHSTGWTYKSRVNSSQSEAIQLCPPGLLKLDGNEVHLGHPDLRDFILSSGEDITGVSFRGQAHAKTTELCLELILSSQARSLLGQYSPGEWEDMTGTEPRLHFLLYAVKYWPVHAKKGGMEYRSDCTALQTMLKDDSLLESWATAYSIFSKTFLRLGLQAGPMSIFAEHGLEGFLARAMASHARALWFGKDISTALVTAAACQQGTILRFLINKGKFDKGVLKDALSASLSLPDENIHYLLLDEILVRSESFNDISDICEKAVGLGHYVLVQELSTWCTRTDSQRGLGAALLRAASILENLEIVKSICNEQQNRISGADQIMSLGLSLKHRHHDTSVFLMETVLADLASDGQQHDSLSQESQQTERRDVQRILKDTVRSGQYRILQSFLGILEARDVRPESVEDLLQISIDHGKTACFECLFKAYFRKADKGMIDSIAMRGTSNMLQTVIKANAGLDKTILTHAIELAVKSDGGDFDLIKVLLKEIQNYVSHEVYRDPVTNLLGSAVQENKPKLAKMLIQAGADIDRKSLCSGSRTPLYQAASSGFEEIAVMLLEAKADPRADWKGWAPIHAAANHARILHSLLQFDVDINARTSDGSTALMLAVKWNQEACVDELLINHPHLHCTSNDGDSLLSSAARTGNPRLIFKLLDAGMDPSHPDVIESNKEQLHKCVEANDVKLLQRLLRYNLPIEHVDHDGRTPLNCIRGETNIEILRLLVYRGAFVNTIDAYDEAPLMTMVQTNNIPKAEFLLSRGATTDIRTSQGHTAFSSACLYGSLKMVQMLANNKASLDEVHDGTPFQFACLRDGDEKEKRAILKYLLDVVEVDRDQKSERWGNNLSLACLTADMEIIRNLVDRGVPVRGYDAMGRRPIHFALYRTIEHVQYLLENGADLFEKDILGRNALHFAVVSGRLDLVKFIIQRKPMLVNEEDCDGWTPLFWAVRECLRWQTSTAEPRCYYRGTQIPWCRNNDTRFWGGAYVDTVRASAILRLG